MIRTYALCMLLGRLAASETAPADLDAAALAARSPLIAALALPAGAWRDLAVTAPDRSADPTRIEAAGGRFLAALQSAKDGPNAEAQKAVAQLVKTLAASTKGEHPDALDPVFARRAVRGGALRRLGAESSEIEQAVAEACRLRTTAAFAGPQGARLEERRDAFGIGAWCLGGTRIAYAVPHPTPHFTRMMPSLALVVELPANADPVTDAGKAEAAALFTGTACVARWSAKDNKLASDPFAWRQVVREPEERDMAKGLFPPHLVLCTPEGDLLRLATLKGSVVPPHNDTPMEAERFLTEAARTLSDTQLLDLIGQYCFSYVYDSPDPRFPLVFGTPDVRGEIHQTAVQTLGTTTCGQFRGDCDDLAELYQSIAERQNRFGHLLLLPSHTAFAVASKDGEDWVIDVMQTGPTLAFARPDVRDALRAAQAHFDPTKPFNPNNFGLLLRFSGENTRGRFGLGWRIFTEREYARTMIDVQRDWQYHTYGHAIAQMGKLIDTGDRDPANLTERAGLYLRTGQLAAAAKQFREVIQENNEPVSRIQEQLLLATVLLRDGKPKEAQAALTEAAATLKRAAPGLGDGVPQIGIRISMGMLQAGDQEGARTVLVTTAFNPLATLVSRLIHLASQPNFDRQAWTGSSSLAPIRGLVRSFVDCLIAHLEKASPETARDPLLVKSRQIVDAWLARLAFLDAETMDMTLDTYSFAARIHALDIGKDALAVAVAAAPMPADGKRDHLARNFAASTQSREADLPWIRMCPAWWMTETFRCIRKDHDEQVSGWSDTSGYIEEHLDPAWTDKAAVAAAACGTSKARAACIGFGLGGRQTDLYEHFAVLATALANADNRVLRERLCYVRIQNDKPLRDASAQMIGRLSPLCSDTQWITVLNIWADEVDYKPKWFSIAWEAAVVGAPNHALAAARMTARRFRDDPIFAEESVFMHQLLGGTLRQGGP